MHSDLFKVAKSAINLQEHSHVGECEWFVFVPEAIIAVGYETRSTKQNVDIHVYETSTNIGTQIYRYLRAMHQAYGPQEKAD